MYTLNANGTKTKVFDGYKDAAISLVLESDIMSSKGTFEMAGYYKGTGLSLWSFTAECPAPGDTKAFVNTLLNDDRTDMILVRVDIDYASGEIISLIISVDRSIKQKGGKKLMFKLKGITVT